MYVDSLLLSVREQIEANRPNYNADSVRAIIDKAPYFSLYKDNYFTGGTVIGGKMKASNSNVKIQISIRQRLTRSKLPFDTYLFIQYTQKAIWNVLEESLPMYDLNYNPGIGLGYLIVNKNKYVGDAALVIEHESNGKDGESSRSWNKLSFSGNLLLSNNVKLQLCAWVPVVDGENNADILKYNGLAEVGLTYRSSDNRFIIAQTSTWRSKSFSFNTQWDFCFKVNKNENQYLYLQYYNGYGECLLDYNQFKSVLRIGFIIKPQSFIIP
jgi:phospholipase A1